MDEERIARALRQGPPDEPVYVPGRILQAVASGRRLGGDRSPTRRLWRGLSSTLQLAATIAIAVALIGTVLLLRPQRAQQVGATPSRSAPPDLLDQVRATERLRIAVRPDAPQTEVRGSLGGFDVDVANELAMRLGLAPELSPLPVADMLADRPDTGWDIALPSAALPLPAMSGLSASAPTTTGRSTSSSPPMRPPDPLPTSTGKRCARSQGVRVTHG